MEKKFYYVDCYIGIHADSESEAMEEVRDVLVDRLKTPHFMVHSAEEQGEDTGIVVPYKKGFENI